MDLYTYMYICMSPLVCRLLHSLLATMSPAKHGPAPSQWKRSTPVALTRESFLELLDGKTPLIKVPHFVSDDVCDKVVDHLMPQFTSYLHATGPAVEKVGLAQFEFQAQSEEDFRNRSGDGEEAIIPLILSKPLFYMVVNLALEFQFLDYLASPFSKCPATPREKKEGKEKKKKKFTNSTDI